MPGTALSGPLQVDGVDVRSPALASPSGLTLWVGASGLTATEDLKQKGVYVYPTLSGVNGALAALSNRTNSGDLINVLPGHTESVTAADFFSDMGSASGFTIQGLGKGSMRPKLTYTATTSTFIIDTANVTVRGIRFYTGIDSLARFITVSADDAIIEDCDFVGASTLEYLNAINITTTYDNTIIRRCKFIQPTDPAGTNAAANTGAIYLVDSENVLIEDCEFRGCFETAFVHNKTTAAANLWVRRCYGRGSTSTSDAVPFVLVSTATGGAEFCSFINPNEAATTEATLSGTFGAGFFNFQSYFGNDGGGGQLAIASQAAAS